VVEKYTRSFTREDCRRRQKRLSIFASRTKEIQGPKSVEFVEFTKNPQGKTEGN
jgi:hypothetical protein